MKKMLIVLLSLMLLATSAFAESETAEPDFTPTDSNILVACFSATGNTWPLAEYAAEYLNADLFRIEPEEPYGMILPRICAPPIALPCSRSLQRSILECGLYGMHSPAKEP